MSTLAAIYRPSLSLLTDLYQLTMAYGLWKTGRAEEEAVFHLFFRTNPFHGGFAIAAGLATAVEYLEGLRFDDDDLAYLATLTGNDGQPLFEQAFLDAMGRVRFAWNIDAMPEGTLVFPHEPLVRVKGPMLHAQLIETALLTLINFQTLVATKAARVVAAAQGEPVVEFGLRRAQGIDGALTASRAAWLGGCAATSNVLAGRLFGIPVRGTHAHSWVMCFDDELSAFRAYAEAMPNNCVFLVDTYDTLDGVRNAVTVGQELRKQGRKMIGIRLDSGDLAWLSIEARKILDEGGFPDAVILASNDLDEHIITSLKLQGATIAAWGVGTRLVTAHDDPALGGVYKLSAIRSAGGPWQYKLKLSEQAIKINNPGILQVRRFYYDSEAAADMIFDIENPPAGEAIIVDPSDATRRRSFAAGTQSEDLLQPVFRDGKRIAEMPSLDQARRRAVEQQAQFHGGIKRLVNPHEYPVGLEVGLHDHKTRLILAARGIKT